ncbi:beta-ketoacyl synthase chain length factor [Reichenbachiella ulvae]|uniref:Beta-ketoacyl synthase chain length factor n=1 Tax=Reichenbachiella ulvae TaxID=2980104 RepID=A0ABT3D121_9BACT|nr:beta-ketoacyl synthase chain length factor [Reichenbachiella ulvae]MCV9389445.1 beta-ketoacyl synthase chain length factor [Reichenbachiella ulvae]
MYIKSAKAISPQHSIDLKLFENEILAHEGTKYYASEPSYADMIPRALLRRMNKAVRMGVGSGLMTLKDQPEMDGIILGTANGGIDDSFKFLHQILEYEEGTLTPTNFVQSTPNAVAGSLALMTKNTGYNNTHVNYGLAFESALLDAMMLFEEGKARHLLVGAFEEISDHNYNMDAQAGYFKSESIKSEDLLGSGTGGTVKGEGSSMFIMSQEAADAKAQVLDVVQLQYVDQKELIESIDQLLSKHQLSTKDVSLMIGANGDIRTDHWYHDLISERFSNQSVYTFKHLVGEYHTTAGFALWLASELLNRDTVPAVLLYQGAHVGTEHLLIYNHFKGKQHSLILVKRPS